jgi:hypothetical protein
MLSSKSAPVAQLDRSSRTYVCAVSSLLLVIMHYVILAIVFLSPHLPNALPVPLRLLLGSVVLYAILMVYLIPIVTPITLLLAIIGVFGPGKGRSLSIFSLVLLIPLAIIEVTWLPGSLRSFGHNLL